MDSLKVDQHLCLHQSEHFRAKFNQVTHPSTKRTCNLHTENFKSEQLEGNQLGVRGKENKRQEDESKGRWDKTQTKGESTVFNHVE